MDDTGGGVENYSNNYNTSSFALPTRLLPRPGEEAVPCYRTLIPPNSTVVTGLWIRQFLESSSSDYLVRILQRVVPPAPDSAPHGRRRLEACLVQCGGGYDLLVLLNDADIPEDDDSIPTIGVVLCLSSTPVVDAHTNNANANTNTIYYDPFEEFGMIGPHTVLAQMCQATVEGGVLAKDLRLHLQTSSSMGGIMMIQHHDENNNNQQQHSMERKRVLRLHTSPVDSWRVHRMDILDATLRTFPEGNSLLVERKQQPKAAPAASKSVTTKTKQNAKGSTNGGSAGEAKKVSAKPAESSLKEKKSPPAEIQEKRKGRPPSTAASKPPQPPASTTTTADSSTKKPETVVASPKKRRKRKAKEPVVSENSNQQQQQKKQNSAKKRGKPYGFSPDEMEALQSAYTSEFPNDPKEEG